MVELQAKQTLGGYSRDLGGVTVVEVDAGPIWSVAHPRGGAVAMPPPGGYAERAGATHIWSAPDQMLVLGDPSTVTGEAYLTDVSDGYVILRLDGPRVRYLLERLSTLDLACMAHGTAQRTQLEHVAATLLCDGAAAFRLLVMRSFAQSLVETLEIAARGLAPQRD